MSENGLRDEEDRTGDSANFGRRAKDNDRMRVRAFGADLEISGTQILTILVVVALIFGFGWLATKHDETTHQLAEQLETLTYVVSLPQDKRDALDLAMPATLRKMQRNR